MDITEIQKTLNLDADGNAGPSTLKAIKEYLGRAYPKVDISGWNKARLLVAMEQAIYASNKMEVGAIDGLVGPSTRYAREIWEAKKTGSEQAVKEITTFKDQEEIIRNTWPTQANVTKFYGKVGTNQTTLVLPYPMYIAWDKGSVINKFSIHEKVHDSALRCFNRIADAYPDADVRRKLGLDLFGGCLNVRQIRGGSGYSMHSWGIAIDFDPDRNQLRWGKDKARLAKPDCETFWKIWESEGWVSLGRARNYDWMHVQAARL